LKLQLSGTWQLTREGEQRNGCDDDGERREQVAQPPGAHPARVVGVFEVETENSEKCKKILMNVFQSTKRKLCQMVK